MYLEDSALKIAEEATRIRIALEKIVAALQRNPLPRPSAFSVRLISERRENDMDLLTYAVTLPTVPEGTDAMSQRFVATWPEGQSGPTDLALTDTTTQFEVPQGTHVILDLRYLDDAGNESPPRTQEFDAIDTIPPEAPGEFGEIRLVSERTVPDV